MGDMPIDLWLKTKEPKIRTNIIWGQGVQPTQTATAKWIKFSMKIYVANWIVTNYIEYKITNMIVTLTIMLLTYNIDIYHFCVLFIDFGLYRLFSLKPQTFIELLQELFVYVLLFVCVFLLYFSSNQSREAFDRFNPFYFRLSSWKRRL